MVKVHASIFLKGANNFELYVYLCTWFLLMLFFLIHINLTLFRYLLSTEYIVERMRVWGGGGRWKGFYRNEAGSTITSSYKRRFWGVSINDLRCACRVSDHSAHWWTLPSQKGHVGLWAATAFPLMSHFAAGVWRECSHWYRKCICLFEGKRWNKRDMKHLDRMCSES